MDFYKLSDKFYKVTLYTILKLDCITFLKFDIFCSLQGYIFTELQALFKALKPILLSLIITLNY